MATNYNPPKFKRNSMGLGELAGPNLIFKRKFRWTFTITPHCSNVPIPPYYVKVASRPNINIDEHPVNFLNARMYIPGKPDWQTMEVTFLDIVDTNAQNLSGITNLYSWLASVYQWNDYLTSYQASKVGSTGGNPGYGATGELTLYDGCGTSLESWQLGNIFPTTVNFGELGYDNIEEANVTVTLRYNYVNYKSLCPNTNVVGCCTGC